MRRPPMITFLTYNRLGETAVSLPSLLRTESDFELYIMDNNSKDDTWEFLEATRDPRIKSRKRFDQNMGVGHALNYALSNRATDQDFINFEYDFRIHNKDFVKDYRDMCEEFPEVGALTATAFPSQLQFIDAEIAKDPTRLTVRNGKRIYWDTIMGFCSYFPYETWNKLMYYDEVNCLLDMDVQSRLEVMKVKTGYAMDIRTSHILHGGNCSTCLAYHDPCEQGEQKCSKNYKRIISQITNEIGFNELHRITFERFEGRMGFECNSIFSGKAMDEAERAASLRTLELFKKFTEESESELSD